MKIFIVLAIFATSCYAGNYDKIVLRFFGTSYSDYQNLTMTGNFSSINGTYFNNTKLSVLIIHGQEQNYTSDFVKELYGAFATRPDYNIILADWGENSTDSYLTLIYSLNEVSVIYYFTIFLFVRASVRPSGCGS